MATWLVILKQVTALSRCHHYQIYLRANNKHILLYIKFSPRLFGTSVWWYAGGSRRQTFSCCSPIHACGASSLLASIKPLKHRELCAGLRHIRSQLSRHPASHALPGRVIPAASLVYIGADTRVGSSGFLSTDTRCEQTFVGNMHRSTSC